MPYICQTGTLAFPGGTKLMGNAPDPNGSALTNVQYQYRTTGGVYKTLTDTTKIPAIRGDDPEGQSDPPVYGLVHQDPTESLPALRNQSNYEMLGLGWEDRSALLAALACIERTAKLSLDESMAWVGSMFSVNSPH
jgi:hypothetical protein